MSATGDRAARGSTDSGTTLIEALAVVTLTTVVGLIAFPRMQQGFLSMARSETAAAVVERLREARAAALGRDGDVVFAAASDGRSYGLSVGPASPTLPGVDVSVDGRNRIIFYGDGTSTGGGVHVRAGKRAIRISVAPTGGAVSEDEQ